MRLAAAAAAVVVIGVVGTIIGSRYLFDEDPTSSAPAAPQPAPAAVPLAPPDIVVSLSSTPKAEVYLVADGVLLGETPLVYKRAPTAGKLVFVLKATGYRDERIVLEADRSTEKTIAMTEIPKPEVADTPEKPAVKAPKVDRCAGVTCKRGFACRPRDGSCVPDTIKVYE